MNLLQTLQKLASEDQYGREICGIVDKNDTIFIMTNVAERPSVSYKLDEGEFAIVLGEIGGIDKVQCIFHSHPSGNAIPSIEDIRCSDELGIDYLILTNTDFMYYSANPKGRRH